MKNSKSFKKETYKVGDLVKRKIDFYGPNETGTLKHFLEPGSLGIIVKIVPFGERWGYKVLTRVGVVNWAGDYALKKLY